MEDVSLTDTESRYFSDLFLCCDVENTGKIPMLKATELYRSANLPNEVISEIISLAGIPSTALHISRGQFYSCLKLIAAYQVAMPLRQELIAASVQLPLPRFSWKDSPSIVDSFVSSSLHPTQQSNGFSSITQLPVVDRKNSLPRGADWQGSGTVLSRRNSTTQQQQEASSHSDVPSTDSEVEQNESSCGGGAGGGVAGTSSRETHRRRGSPEAWSTNSDSPTPTNSVAERPWAKETLWQGLLGDEHRQLLGTEEESSDRHSSDDDNETDLETIYQITPEQREYYFKQFKAVQHDTNGLLSGQVARIFFEKSRIPVEELRHIWQLCDVTRDGALSLAEFTAAMHLVVLRRNNIPLPTVLPTCLHPNVLPPQEPPEADLLHLNDDDDEDNTEKTILGATGVNVSATGVNAVRVPNEKNALNLNTISTLSQSSTSSRQGINAAASTHTSLTPPALSPSVKNRSVSNSPNVDPNVTPPNQPTGVITATKPKEQTLWTTDLPPSQWTKFTESPTSNVSSPGPKPVNFDMQRTAQAVVSDPQILHPVPLRVTPVAGSAAANNSTDAHNIDAYDSVSFPDTSSQQQTQQVSTSTAPQPSTHRDSMQNNDLRAIQRPQAKKLPAKNIGALPPPPQRESSIGSAGSASAIGAAGDGNELQNGNVLPQQQQPILSKKEPPPLPPPRPHRHGRSSSLDLNKFKMNAPTSQQSEITAQASFDLQTSTGFADFTNFPDGANHNDQIYEQQQHSLPPKATVSVLSKAATASSHPLPPSRFTLQSNQRVSAFEVYRKPNTPRNSQSPTAPVATTVISETTVGIGHVQTHSHQHHSQPTQPPPPAPFGAVGAAIALHPPQTAHPLLNTELYEKRVNAISETLKHVSFKQDNNMPDVLRHLREQNNLLLRLCNDLSDELLTVQMRKEDMRLKLEAVTMINANVSASTEGASTFRLVAARTGSSISAPVTANVTGDSGSSDVHSNV